MDLSIDLSQLYDAFVKATRFSAVNISLEKYSEQLRKCICDFQLRYANYKFGASRMHMILKESSSNHSSELFTHHEKLTEFVEKGLKTMCGDISQAIQDYFSLTHNHKAKPRVGIHAVNEQNDVIDLIMLPSGANNLYKKIEDYIVFYSIQSTGLPYLENHLPKAAKYKDDFYHGGLNVDKIKASYKMKQMDKKVFSRFINNFYKKERVDSEWNNMKSIKDNTTKPLYKSSIAVPITFRAHADKAKLDSHMTETLGIPNEGRSILGFVCADHPATYYFDDGPVETYENIDINTLYIFADMISLVMVAKWMYTDGSRTYRSIEQRGSSQ